jgi:hypothetical protein
MRAPVAAAGLVTLALILAACPADEPAPETLGPPAACVVGDWQSVGVDTEVGGDLAGITVGGGSRVALTVGTAGATTVGFAGMVPVSFHGQVFGVNVAGDLAYGGHASGRVATEPDVTSGVWQMVEPVDWSEVSVTLDLTEPVRARPFEDAPLGDVIEEVDEVTGEVVDVDPVLSDGTFRCEGDELVLSPADDGITWTFRRL